MRDDSSHHKSQNYTQIAFNMGCIWEKRLENNYHIKTQAKCILAHVLYLKARHSY